MLCECGCGQTAPIARQSDTRSGYERGKPKRFIVGHSQQRTHKGRYYTVYRPDHPRASASGEVYEHVIVAEQSLGRYLPGGAEVHHVDENKLNNSRRNLVICQDAAYHKLLHVRARTLVAGGNPNTQKICGECQRVLDFDRFARMRSNKSHGRSARCRECASAAYKGYVRPARRLVIPDPDPAWAVR